MPRWRHLAQHELEKLIEVVKRNRHGPFLAEIVPLYARRMGGDIKVALVFYVPFSGRPCVP